MIDNYAIHYKLSINEFLIARQIRIKYLPPYSPDFNSIKTTFYMLKMWL